MQNGKRFHSSREDLNADLIELLKTTDVTEWSTELALAVRAAVKDSPLLRLVAGHLVLPGGALGTELTPFQGEIERAAESVGRLEYWVNNRFFGSLGTGWLISEEIVVTAAHVIPAAIVGNQTGSHLKIEETFNPKIFFAPFHEEGYKFRFRVEVEEVTWLANSSQADLAFLKLTTQNRVPFRALTLGTGTEGSLVVTIGHPQTQFPDDRFIDEPLEINGLKKVSQGRIELVESQTFNFSATTHGGSSGGPVIDLETGEVVGVTILGPVGQDSVAVQSAEVAALFSLI